MKIQKVRDWQFAQLSVLTTASVVLFNHHEDKSLSSDGVTNVIAPIDLNLGPVGNTSQRTFEIHLFYVRKVFAARSEHIIVPCL